MVDYHYDDLGNLTEIWMKTSIEALQAQLVERNAQLKKLEKDAANEAKAAEDLAVPLLCSTGIATRPSGRSGFRLHPRLRIAPFCCSASDSLGAVAPSAVRARNSPGRLRPPGRILAK